MDVVSKRHHRKSVQQTAANWSSEGDYPTNSNWIDLDTIRNSGDLVNTRWLVVSGTRYNQLSILSWHVIWVNMIMLGFFAAVSDLVSHDALREAVRASVPEGTEELNLSAFDKGYAYGRERSVNKGK